MKVENKNGNLSRKFVYLPSAVVTDNSGNVKKKYRYYAFGNLRAQSGSFNTDYSFTGYLKEETGNHYAKMRYYEGGIGRFLRVDPLGALNPYVYCGNDPLNFVDPWGLTHQQPMGPPGTFYTGWVSCPLRGAGGMLDASGIPFQYTFDNFYEKRDRQFREAVREASRILPTFSPFDNYEIQGGPLLACACDGTEGVVTDVPMFGASLAPIGYAEHSYCVKLENCKADALEILEGDLKAIESLMNDYYAGDPFTREYLKIRYEIEGYILFTGMRLQVYGKYWGSYNKCELKWRLPCIVEIPHVQ